MKAKTINSMIGNKVYLPRSSNRYASFLPSMTLNVAEEFLPVTDEDYNEEWFIEKKEFEEWGNDGLFYHRSWLEFEESE